jgi:hypothetical protein
MRGATRFAIAAALVALAAQPALAGVVYVPATDVQRDGIQRTTQVTLTNPDPANFRGVKVRFIQSGVAGTPLPAGPFPTLWTPAGGSGPLPLSTAILPDAKAGMLEVFPLYLTQFVVGGRLTYTKQGVYSTSVDVPAISSNNVMIAGHVAYLQGLEHGNNSGILTDLGVFNLSTSASSCIMDVTGPTGTAIATGVTFSLPALSSLVYADYFGPTATTAGIEVPANSWAKVTCDRAFFAMAIRHNANTGATSLALPTDTLAQSMLTQPGAEPPPPPPGGQYNFRLPGLFLECSRYNKYWKTSLTDSRVAGKTMKKMVVDFDVYHANWDPQKNTHIYMWLQNGPSWSSSLFGYLIASRRAGVMRIQVKYGASTQLDSGPAGQPGNTYHVHYEWDGITRKIWFKMYTQSGNIRAQKTINNNKGTFNVGGMFFATGSWPTGDGPEALQYGWKYSNLNVNYYQ